MNRSGGSTSMTVVDSFKHKTGQNLNMTIITAFPSIGNNQATWKASWSSVHQLQSWLQKPWGNSGTMCDSKLHCAWKEQWLASHSACNCESSDPNTTTYLCCLREEKMNKTSLLSAGWLNQWGSCRRRNVRVITIKYFTMMASFKSVILEGMCLTELPGVTASFTRVQNFLFMRWKSFHTKVLWRLENPRLPFTPDTNPAYLSLFPPIRFRPVAACRWHNPGN